MGQWSDPVRSRIVESMATPSIRKASEVRNLSSLQLTWCAPVRLFDQVYNPLLCSKSIRLSSSMRLLKSLASRSNLLEPPFFSARLRVMLKSPSMIHLSLWVTWGYEGGYGERPASPPGSLGRIRRLGDQADLSQ